ncbi:MAG TPA: YqaJ viral recombinase family protein [Chondromyces sp.]|nr:YqaJ viral recombinase family protein [Chondromyces sp.]
MKAIRLASTLDLPHEEWLTYRRRGISGTDVGAICGVDKWRSPIAVYLEKTGQVPKREENEAMYFGRLLEEVVADEFAKRTGYKIQRSNAILQHPENEWAIGNIDRLILDSERGNGVLEVKTASEYVKKEWEDGNIPEAYQLQLQWYLYITDLKWGAFAVLIGGNKFQYKMIERDQEIIDLLIKICKNFWENHLLAGIPPLVDGSEASADLLNRMYPEGEADSKVVLPDEAEELIIQWEQANEDMEEAEERKRKAENRLKALIGEYEVGITPEHTVTWKNVSRHTIDTKALKAAHPDIYKQFVKPSRSRRFLIK